MGGWRRRVEASTLIPVLLAAGLGEGGRGLVEKAEALKRVAGGDRRGDGGLGCRIPAFLDHELALSGSSGTARSKARRVSEEDAVERGDRIGDQWR